MKKVRFLFMLALLFGGSFWIFRPASTVADSHVMVELPRELEISLPILKKKALPVQTIKKELLPLSESEIEKMLDENDVCAYYKNVGTSEDLIRTVLVKRISNLSSLLFSTGEELDHLRDNPDATVQFYLGLYHAGLIVGTPPPTVDYPEAMRFIDQAIASENEGEFYLYKSYIYFLMGQPPSAVKGFLLDALGAPAYAPLTATLVHQVISTLGTNATSWAALRLILAKVSIPVPPPLSFFKAVLKDADPEELTLAVDWGMRLNTGIGIILDKAVGRHMVKTFWEHSTHADEELPDFPPLYPTVVFPSDTEMESFEIGRTDALCNPEPLLRMFRHCQIEDCGW